MASIEVNLEEQIKAANFLYPLEEQGNIIYIDAPQSIQAHVAKVIQFSDDTTIVRNYTQQSHPKGSKWILNETAPTTTINRTLVIKTKIQFTKANTIKSRCLKNFQTCTLS